MVDGAKGEGEALTMHSYEGVERNGKGEARLRGREEVARLDHRGTLNLATSSTSLLFNGDDHGEHGPRFYLSPCTRSSAALHLPFLRLFATTTSKSSRARQSARTLYRREPIRSSTTLPTTRSGSSQCHPRHSLSSRSSHLQTKIRIRSSSHAKGESKEGEGSREMEEDETVCDFGTLRSSYSRSLRSCLETRSHGLWRRPLRHRSRLYQPAKVRPPVS